jgi:predicted nucleic acid-binding protein
MPVWPSPGVFQVIPRKIPTIAAICEIADSIFGSFNKRKRITERQIEDFLRRLKELAISVEERGLWSNVDLEAPARRWNLSSHDAAYLDLALRTGMPLATIDHDLKKAAAAEGIEVVS